MKKDASMSVTRLFSDEGARKGKGTREAGGYLLLEIMFVSALLALSALVVLPNAARLYRSVLLEYEAERFFSELRYLQRLSRTTMGRVEAGQAVGTRGTPALFLNDGGSSYAIVSIGDSVSGITYRKTYELHPDIAIRWERARSSPYNATVRFDENGRVSYAKNAVRGGAAGYTFVVYHKRYPSEAIRIIIDPAGRIRMARLSEQ